METQNFANHSTLKSLNRTTIIFYTLNLALICLAFATVVRSISLSNERLISGLLLLVAFIFVNSYFLFRSYALKAQDRAIRAEENLRHFALTGKLLNNNLKINQIVALRFAPDEEFVALAERAVKENLSNTAIKKEIKNWKADYHRA